MGQVYQPGRWQEIEGVPDETTDADMLAAVRNVVRTQTAASLPKVQPAPNRVSQWQPVQPDHPKQSPEAAAKSERALMLRLLDRLRG